MKILRSLMIEEKNVEFIKKFPSMSQYVDDLITAQREKNTPTTEEELINSWLALEKNQQATIKANQDKIERMSYLNQQIVRLTKYINLGKGFPSDEERLKMFKAELENLEKET